MAEGTCCVSGCALDAICRGWCATHYMRHRRRGTTDLTPLRLPAGERLWRNVARGDVDECWNWRGQTIRNGYGRISVAGRKTLVHRLAYELLVGPIPEGLTIDHLCRNKRCVNPAHLEVVTVAENNRRAREFVATQRS